MTISMHIVALTIVDCRIVWIGIGYKCTSIMHVWIIPDVLVR